MVSEQELAEWEALCKAATEGPWDWEVDDTGALIQANDPDCCILEARIGPHDEAYVDISDANEDFIAAAREAMPRLIAEVRRLRNICGDGRLQHLDTSDNSVTVENYKIIE